jgi:carboxynorspermidine decarboxylase
MSTDRSLHRAALADGIGFDPYGLETPYFVVDLGLLRRNLAVLQHVGERSGAKVLLALKGFAMWSVFPLARPYLSGITASSVNEARLGREEFGGEVHAYAPAYSEAEIAELLTLADHVVLNSVTQLAKYEGILHGAGVQCGLRVNPEHREVETELYDPCAPGSRLGVREATLRAAPPELLARLDGLHFHNLCQKNSDALERTLMAVESRFADFIAGVRWVNFGGGHHISRPDYDVERLIRVIVGFSERYGKQVYLEPGEASALNTGFLVAGVLDIVPGPAGGLSTAILDTSATAHMPDVLEMPYRPEILGGDLPGQQAHTYRLGGLTCLAGDVIGDYSFEQPLEVGDRLVFTDMAHYTMVKSTMFNGVRHPSIATFEPETGALREVRRFGYLDYKGRLS